MPKGNNQAQTVANERRRANRRSRKGRRQHEEKHSRGRGKPVAAVKPDSDGNWSFASIQAAYAACVRCGYFLSGYRLAAGQAVLDQAVADIRGAWLELDWLPALRELLEKSYGIRLDSDVYHYKGRCTECARVFVLRAHDAVSAGDMEAEMETETETQTEPEIETPGVAAAASEAVGDAVTEAEELAIETETETEIEAETESAATDLAFRIQIRPRPR